MPPGGLILASGPAAPEARMDRIAQGPLDLSRFETSDVEDRVPRLTLGNPARRRKVGATPRPKTMAEMIAVLSAEETVCKEPGCSRVIDDIYTYCFRHT